MRGRKVSVLATAAARQPANLVDEELFAFILEREVHKSARLRYCLSVLCVTPDISDTDGALLHRFAECSVRQLRAFDLAASFTPSCVALLLVDAELENVARIVDRLTRAFPLRNGESAGRFSLSAGAGSYPRTAGTSRELFGQAVDLMMRAREDGGRRLYLAS